MLCGERVIDAMETLQSLTDSTSLSIFLSDCTARTMRRLIEKLTMYSSVSMNASTYFEFA